MGTNYYCRQALTFEQKKEVIDLVEKDKFYEVKEYLEKNLIEYHIGKRSYGWAFLFQAYKDSKPWEPNIESLRKFLQRPDVTIYDEYGEEFTFGQFWDEEVGATLHVSEKYKANNQIEDTH